MSNRIRDLREARGWTLEELGHQMGGTGASTVGKLERGEMRLLSPWVDRLAAAFGIDWVELFRDPAKHILAGLSGLAEEATPFAPEPGNVLAGLRPGRNQDWWTLRTNHLADIGFNIGDLLLVDHSQEIVAQIRQANIVIVQVYASEALAATTVVRQYIEPHMLIPNTAAPGVPAYHMKRDDVAVKGVVVGRMTSINGR